MCNYVFEPCNVFFTLSYEREPFLISLLIQEMQLDSCEFAQNLVSSLEIVPEKIVDRELSGCLSTDTIDYQVAYQSGDEAVCPYPLHKATPSSTLKVDTTDCAIPCPSFILTNEEWDSAIQMYGGCGITGLIGCEFLISF